MQQHRPEGHVVHEEQILEAIDQLRRRKARPDADRICNYLLRKFSVDARDTISDLHRLIEAEKVIQVDYKGNTSYRNASKWSRLQLYKNRPEGFVKEKLNSSMMASAFAELVVEEPDYLDQGVPAFRLVEQLLDGVLNPTSRKMVEDFLAKEVASGNVTRMSNGNYSLVGTNDVPSEKREDKRKHEGDSKEFFEYAEGNDSTNGTSRSSRQTSPKDEADDGAHLSLKKEETTVRRSNKSERKQRLLVRPDDSMDLEIKFEEYGEKYRGKKSREAEGEQSEDRDDEENGRNSANTSPGPGTVGGFRSARRKRAKKVFDPSDSNIPKRKRGRQPVVNKTNVQAVPELAEAPIKTTSKDANRQCSLCAKEKAEQLVACRDCTVRAHPGCIWSPEEIMHKTGASWQCERCKTCAVCCETSETGALITCTICNDSYHYVCHTPRVPSSKSHAKWQCCGCSEKRQKIVVSSSSEIYQAARADSPINQPTYPPVLSPQVSPSRGSSDPNDDESVFKDGIDPTIPDASDWTVEQVYQYFARLFPKEAEVFRLQDIDGHSLLLMTRKDVLTGLDLLLGPALKIWRHVLKLQLRRDDTRYYWL